MQEPYRQKKDSSKIVSFFEIMVLPFWQSMVLLSSTAIIFLVAYYALKDQISLEKYPQITPITQQHIQEWGGEPTLVEVGLQITNFPTFKVLEDEFVLEGKLWFFFDPDLVSLETIKTFSFENGTYIQQSEPEMRLINQKLLMEYNIRLTFNTELTYQAFPLDSHRIFISLVNMSVDPNEVIFQVNKTHFSILPQVFIPEWKHAEQNVYSGYIHSQLDTDDTQKSIRYPKVIFSIDFHRSGLRHIFIILLPLFLVCAMAMLALGVQHIINGKSLDITAAAAASIIAYRFVIETMSPHVSYLMLADYIFIFFLVAACTMLMYAKITYQQIILPSWIIIRGILFLSFYLGIIALWYSLIFIWIPSKKPVNTILSKEITLSYQEKEILPLPTDSLEPQKVTVPFGSIMDLSRMNRAFGRQIKSGISLRVRKAIETNELPHYQLQAFFVDDESSIVSARTEMNYLLDKKVSFLLSPYSSRSIKGYLELISQKKIGILFPVSGTEKIRKKELSNIIIFRPSQKEQGAALAEYAIKTIDAHKIGIFYENSLMGNNALSGVQSVLKRYNINPDRITEISYEGHDILFTNQINQLKNADPETILFFCSGRAFQQLIHQYGLENFIGKNLLGTSQLNQIFFQRILKNKGLSLITCNVVPNPATSTIQLAREFREMANRYNVPLGPYALEGYINTEIFIYLLKQLHDTVTASALISLAEKIHNLDLKGIKLNFNPETRELSNTLWLDTGESEWVSITPQ